MEKKKTKKTLKDDLKKKKTSAPVKKAKKKTVSPPKKITPKKIIPKKTTPKTKAGGEFSFLEFTNDLAQALLVVAVILLLSISFIVVGAQKRTEEKRRNNNIANFQAMDGSKFIKKKDGFFGKISFLDKNLNSSGASKTSGLEAGFYSGEFSFNEASDSLVSGAIFPGYYDSDLKNYNYVYLGEDFSLANKAQVYNRLIPDLDNDLNLPLAKSKNSFFNLQRFKDIKINNISIDEDRDFGYSVYLDFKNGNFSVYKNWEKWPSLESSCLSYGYDQECFVDRRLGIEDFLNDDEILEISNKFLRDYGINLANYSAGEVQREWIKEYFINEKDSSFYSPEFVNIIYPLKINGLEVYEGSGQKMGINVEVDLREKRVSGVYNLFYQHYENSIYEVETDKNLIVEHAQKGGLYPSFYYSDNKKEEKIDLELGTPSLALLKTWQYDEKNRKGYELYVPVYVFPILSNPQDLYFSQKNVIVPALKDFFTNDNNFYDNFGFDLILEKNGDQPEIRIMEEVENWTEVEGRTIRY